MEGDEDNVCEQSEGKEWKACLVGDTGVGKSSIITRIRDSSFCVNALTTTGATFAMVRITVDNQQHRFKVWDTPGQERFRFFAPVYYRGIRAAILVYSVLDRNSYRSITDHWVPSVKSHKTSDGRNIIICLVGNKSDVTEDREVSREEAEAFAAESGAIYIETSAYTGNNVDQLFQELARRVTAEAEDEKTRTKATPQSADDVTDSGTDNSKQQHQQETIRQHSGAGFLDVDIAKENIELKSLDSYM